MIPVIMKQFENPDETRPMEKGKFEILRFPGMTLGRATYEPGWKWSEHVGRGLGQALCSVEHVGMVLSGTAVVSFENGDVLELPAGSVFHGPAVPHDSWVVGEGTYVSLHLMGADDYANSEPGTAESER
jgi:hypothetical protein